MKFASLAVVLATVLVAACSKPVDSLAGCYAFNPSGKVNLEIAEQDDDSFGLSTLEGKTWSSPPQALTQLDPTTINAALGGTEDNPVALAGLKTADDNFVIYHLAEDAQIEGKAPDSRYLSKLYFGSGTIYQKSCPEN